MAHSAYLASRALLQIGGADSVDFLQNLVTCDIASLQEGDANFGALLTPQGKVLFDFHIYRRTDRFILDMAAEQRDELRKRLMFYRLRAKVDIEPLEDAVFAGWGEGIAEGVDDARLGALGKRWIGKGDAGADADENAYHEHRIALGVPQSGADFDLGGAFPHEVLMDQFGKAGVDFSKGCYVGQEVVSRMQHRGTARSRFVMVRSKGGEDLPAKDTHVAAGERTIGKMGSHAGADGLALLRLDRAAAAMAGSEQITCGSVEIEARLPDFVNFDWPQ